MFSTRRTAVSCSALPTWAFGARSTCTATRRAGSYLYALLCPIRSLERVQCTQCSSLLRARQTLRELESPSLCSFVLFASAQWYVASATYSFCKRKVWAHWSSILCSSWYSAWCRRARARWAASRTAGRARRISRAIATSSPPTRPLPRARLWSKRRPPRPPTLPRRRRARRRRVLVLVLVRSARAARSRRRKCRPSCTFSSANQCGRCASYHSLLRACAPTPSITKSYEYITTRILPERWRRAFWTCLLHSLLKHNYALWPLIL